MNTNKTNLDKNKGKDLIRIIEIVLMAISLFILISDRFLNFNSYILYAASVYIFENLLFISPVLDFLEEHKGKKIRIVEVKYFVIQGIASVIFIISGYKSFLSSEENLHLSYWLCIISFFLLLCGDFIRCLVKRRMLLKEVTDKEGKKEVRKKYPVSSHIFILIFIGFAVYNILDSKSVVDFKNIKNPEKIVITKIYSNKKTNAGRIDDKAISEFLKNRKPDIEITDKKFIQKFVDEIRGNNKVENIRGFDKLDYLKIADNNEYRYLLFFEYKNNIKRKLENGLMYSMTIYPGKYVVVEEIKDKRDMFMDIFVKYRITLPETTLNKVISVYENYNK